MFFRQTVVVFYQVKVNRFHFCRFHYLPQSVSQYGGEEGKEAARAVLRCWYTKPTKQLSETLDTFSSIFSHLPTRNSESTNKQSDVTAWSFWIKLDPFP